MTIKDVYELNEGIKIIASKELPVKVAFLIQQNIAMINTEIKNAEEVRKKLIDRHKDEEATQDLKLQGAQGQVKIKEDEVDEFHESLNELMQQKVDVELKKISLQALEGVMIKPIELYNLRNIIEE